MRKCLDSIWSALIFSFSARAEKKSRFLSKKLVLFEKLSRHPLNRKTRQICHLISSTVRRNSTEDRKYANTVTINMSLLAIHWWVVDRFWAVRRWWRDQSEATKFYSNFERISIILLPHMHHSHGYHLDLLPTLAPIQADDWAWLSTKRFKRLSGTMWNSWCRPFKQMLNSIDLQHRSAAKQAPLCLQNWKSSELAILHSLVHNFCVYWTW